MTPETGRRPEGDVNLVCFTSPCGRRPVFVKSLSGKIQEMLSLHSFKVKEGAYV